MDAKPPPYVEPSRAATGREPFVDVPGAGCIAAALGLILSGSVATAADLGTDAYDAADNPAAAGRLPDAYVYGERDARAKLSLDKYAEPLLTTAQTATVVPAELMDAEGVNSLRDGLRNVAGVSIGAGEGSYQGDNFSIRGFAARADLYLDGFNDWGSYTRDAFNTEEVEVLKGPSSAEFGRGSTGGVVNTESKQPLRDGFLVTGAELGTDATRRLTLDFDTPLESLPGAALRVNAMAYAADLAGRPGPYYARWGFAPTLLVGADTPTRLTLAYFIQHQNDLPDYGLPWINDRPAPVPHGAYYGFTDGANYFDTTVQFGTFRLEHDLGANATVNVRLRLADYRRALEITQADPPGQTQNNGDADFGPGVNLATVLVDRTQIDGRSTARSIEPGIDLVLRATGKGWRNQLDLGSEYLRQTDDPQRIEPCWVGVSPTPLLNPQPGDPFTGSAAVPGQTCTNVNAYVDDLSGYLIDTLKLGERWTWVGTVRVDRIASAYAERSPTTALAFGVDPLAINLRSANTLPSFRAALTYQPLPNASVYLSTGTSIHPNVAQVSISSELPLTAPPAWSVAPIAHNVEAELGTKWLIGEGRLALDGAIFYDALRNAAGTDVDDPLNYVTGARERVEGAELSLVGRLGPRARVFLTYTYQDGVVTGSSDPTLLGQQLLNSPRNSASLFTTYDFAARWQAGVGANEVDSRTGWEQPDPANGLILKAPGYVVANAMLRYGAPGQTTVQLNVQNLFDRFYYDGVHPGHVVPGAGRAAYLRLTYPF